MRKRPPKVTGGSLVEPMSQQPGQQQGAAADAGEDRDQGIRFADVADHLGGVDQVIDGNEVEAGAELVEEEVLGAGVEQQHASKQEKAAV